MASEYDRELRIVKNLEGDVLGYFGHNIRAINWSYKKLHTSIRPLNRVPSGRKHLCGELALNKFA
jgi:hypothetical protein